MRASDWSRQNLLRCDWLGPSVAPITTEALLACVRGWLECQYFSQRM